MKKKGKYWLKMFRRARRQCGSATFDRSVTTHRSEIGGALTVGLGCAPRGTPNWGFKRQNTDGRW